MHKPEGQGEAGECRGADLLGVALDEVLAGVADALLRLLLAEVAAGVLDRPRLARLDVVDQRLLQPLLRTRVDLAVRAALRVAGEVEGRTSMSSQ